MRTMTDAQVRRQRQGATNAGTVMENGDAVIPRDSISIDIYDLSMAALGRRGARVELTSQVHAVADVHDEPT